jgi:hypothetical protein
MFMTLGNLARLFRKKLKDETTMGPSEEEEPNYEYMYHKLSKRKITIWNS